MGNQIVISSSLVMIDVKWAILKNSFLFSRIDASVDDGSMGRLINDDHITPNANIKCIMVDDVPRLCIYAVGHIKKGEEIRYNYGRNIDFPWRNQV